MEALLIIFTLILGLIAVCFAIFISFRALSYALYFGLFYWPWFLGVIGGAIIWLLGDRALGNVMVIGGFVVGIAWGFHTDKQACNCIFHKVLRKLDSNL